ncbi:hypothetical protein THAOC_09002, partial [Thalassiosira oceanica]
MIGGGEVNTVTAMVDAADGLAWSRDGDDNMRLRIFRTDGGGEKEGGREGGGGEGGRRRRPDPCRPDRDHDEPRDQGAQGRAGQGRQVVAVRPEVRPPSRRRGVAVAPPGPPDGRVRRRGRHGHVPGRRGGRRRGGGRRGQGHRDGRGRDAQVR